MARSRCSFSILILYDSEISPDDESISHIRDGSTGNACALRYWLGSVDFSHF